MSTDSEERGARRRAAIRRALGKPGSLRRWIAGTAIWLLAWSLVSLYVGWLARIAIFFVASLLAIAAYKARPIAIGDEDEFRAAMRRERAASPDATAPEEDEVRLDPEFWLSRGGRAFDGVPPPPILDDEDVRAAQGAEEPRGESDVDLTRRL